MKFSVQLFVIRLVLVQIVANVEVRHESILH